MSTLHFTLELINVLSAIRLLHLQKSLHNFYELALSLHEMAQKQNQS